LHITAAPKVATVPDVVDADYEDEASASNITTNDLLPPSPTFIVPPMEWLLGGPSASWLIDGPERDFSNEDFEAPPLHCCSTNAMGSAPAFRLQRSPTRTRRT
jgi:hypothetical protein